MIAALVSLAAVLTPGTAQAAFPGANGKIVFVSLRDGGSHIYTMYEDGSSQRQLTSTPGDDSDPTWSADGAKIAFTRTVNGFSDIWVMNADGSGQRNLTRSADPFDSRPAWSPDGTKIAFMASISPTFDSGLAPFVMNADGTGKTQLPIGGPGQLSAPVWSPDGRRIAYQAAGPGVGDDIWVANADGSNAADLTNSPGADIQPEWSPDGNAIYFASNRGGQSEIYRMSADGTGVARLIPADFSDEDPAASPDGDRVAFARHSVDRAGQIGVDIYWMGSSGLLGGRLTNDGASFEPDWQAGETDNPVLTCGSADGLWHGGNVPIFCSARDDGAGLANPGDSSFELVTSVPLGAENANASTDSHEVCDRVGNCVTAGPIGGNMIDRKAPVLSLPADQIVPAPSPDGAVVTYAVSASDGAQPDPDLSCDPASGSVFPIGTTQVNCTATDHVGNVTSGSFSVDVGGAETPVGSNVPVVPVDSTTGTTPVSITFANVTTEGVTNLSTMSSGPAPQSGFRVQGVYYELTTTAVFDSAEVCFPYSSPRPVPVIMHWVGGVPVIEPTTQDTGTEVCAVVTSFSPFALVAPTAPADTDPPAISCGSTDGAWHAANVSIACTAFDAGSGLSDPADASFALTTSVPAGAEDANASTGSRTVCDTAGNCATAGPVGGNEIDRKSPALTLPADQTVDATSPAGAVLRFSAQATDGADPNPSVSCSPRSGSLFAIGRSTVTCTATDHVGNATSGSFAVIVLGAKEQLNALIRNVVNTSKLPAAAKAQLIANLQALVAKFDPTKSAQRQAVCAALELFVNAVKRLSGHGISPSQAAEWTAEANRIRAVLGCGGLTHHSRASHRPRHHKHARLRPASPLAHQQSPRESAL